MDSTTAVRPSAPVVLTKRSPAPVADSGTRGRRPSRLLGIRNDIPLSWHLGFGAVGVAAIFGLWLLLSARLGSAGSAIVSSNALRSAVARSAGMLGGAAKGRPKV